MTDRDNITLPREVVEQLLKMLEMVEPYADQLTDYSSTAAEWPLNLLPEKVGVAITALRTHLAAEQPKVSEDIEALRRDAERFWMVVAAMNEKLKPVAWMFVNSDGECEQIQYGTPPTDDDSITPLYIAPPEDEALRRDAELGRWIREETPPIEEIAARVDAMEDER